MAPNLDMQLVSDSTIKTSRLAIQCCNFASAVLDSLTYAEMCDLDVSFLRIFCGLYKIQISFLSNLFEFSREKRLVRTIASGSAVSQRHALPEALPHKDFDPANLGTDLSDIDGLRTTEDLPIECDVVIIGAGPSGASVAYHLLADGPGSSLSVTMLEARQVCSGATGRNGEFQLRHNLARIDALLLRWPFKLGWQNILEFCKQVGDEQCAALADFFLAQIPALKDMVEKEA